MIDKMKLWAIRGAITIPEDTPGAVKEATGLLLQELMRYNAISPVDIVSIIFTATGDICSEFPAVAARELGLNDTPLICAREIPKPDALPFCIRVLLHFYTPLAKEELKPVYLRDAVKLRPDLKLEHIVREKITNGANTMTENLTRKCIDQIPPYIPGKPIEEVERELGLTGVIKMASNENPLGPANEVCQTIFKTIERIALYPDANAFYLKEALAHELGVAAENLLIGNGLDDVNRIVGEAFLEPGDEVMIPWPTFSQYETVTRLMGANPIFIRGNGLEHDLEMMRAAITSQTKLVYLCNPNNPTGSIIKEEALRRFIKDLPQSALLIIDEAYADFADDSEFPKTVELWKDGHPNILIFRTFSKIHGLAGLRLGFAIAVPSIITALNKVKDPFNVNLLALTAGITALASKKHISLSKELVFEGRRCFYRELDDMGVVYLPTQANFILIHCGRDSREIYQQMLQRGIIVRPTHSFGLPEYIRVTFGTAEQNTRFLSAFREVLAKERSSENC